MTGVIFGLFVISFLLIIATINLFLASKRTASYPPKHVLKKRAMTFGASGMVLFLLAFTLYYVT
ncbi:hypothetical protein [Metabacillus iocasae]|uniref:Uncharacterized protein n=1 Tax=Priestia iocasae TaxID=2291674 RepID=A0ABS2QUL7_9BACI|nr:hypothetical protein [Metabacillus iocasae]MBM7702682.1 hypothetical protein [Metabacillus iocasae]